MEAHSLMLDLLGEEEEGEEWEASGEGYAGDEGEASGGGDAGEIREEEDGDGEYEGEEEDDDEADGNSESWSDTELEPEPTPASDAEGAAQQPEAVQRLVKARAGASGRPGRADSSEAPALGWTPRAGALQCG